MHQIASIYNCKARSGLLNIDCIHSDYRLVVAAPLKLIHALVIQSSITKIHDVAICNLTDEVN